MDQSFSAPLSGRVTVRGTQDDEKTDAELQAWEAAVRADAAENGGIVPPEVSALCHGRTVRLRDAKPDLPPPSDTETELNGLIAECRFLMREVAYTSACLTYDPGDRIQFLNAAQSMAMTAARIGKTVAQLRTAGTPPPSGETRQRITVEHLHPSLRKPRGEGGRRQSAESGKQ